MDITMYWGSIYIMTFKASDSKEFREKVLSHVEKYWSNLQTEDFFSVWHSLQTNGHGDSGRFQFFKA